MPHQAIKSQQGTKSVCEVPTSGVEVSRPKVASVHLRRLDVLDVHSSAAEWHPHVHIPGVLAELHISNPKIWESDGVQIPLYIKFNNYLVRAQIVSIPHTFSISNILDLVEFDSLTNRPPFDLDIKVLIKMARYSTSFENRFGNFVAKAEVDQSVVELVRDWLRRWEGVVAEFDFSVVDFVS